jgi:hypothetical protein
MNEHAIVAVVQTDPVPSDVNDLIESLARLLDGFIHDCVNGSILSAGANE